MSLPDAFPGSTPAPEVLYRSRLAQQERNAAGLERRHVLLGYLRLVTGVLMVILLWPAVHGALAYVIGVALAIVAFAAAGVMHGRVLAQLARSRRAIAFYQHGLARVEDRWAGLQPRQTRADLESSLFATDLDLFGPQSLFELLCEARTTLGEDRLSDWLLRPAHPDEVRQRQTAIADLRNHLDLREAWASAPGPAIASLHKEGLLRWAESLDQPLPRSMRWLCPLLVALTVAAGVRYALTQSPILLVLMLVLDASLTFFLKSRYLPLFTEAQKLGAALRTSARLFGHLEAERFTAPLLIALQRAAQSSGLASSGAIRNLAQLATWMDARENYIVKLLDAPLLFSLQLAGRVQSWRTQHGKHLRAWLDTLAEFEALLSLAGFSFEHPGDPFPALEDGPASFDAKELGHPLLAAASCVRNDLSFGGTTRLVVVSGSNMSGKSTLLRSVGINAVLAFAGGTVRAGSLRLSPMRVAASIQVQDSLQGGRSRFFAEILRLRAITEAAHNSGPVLYLLDELLAGTNSLDRLTGAHGLIRELLSTASVGLLSTHDLALTQIAEADIEGVRNVHFEDQITGEALQFDYKLREGVVERSNGVALMRLIGLKV